MRAFLKDNSLALGLLSVWVGISLWLISQRPAPIEVTVPYNPDACTKADLAKLAERVKALESR